MKRHGLAAILVLIATASAQQEDEGSSLIQQLEAFDQELQTQITASGGGLVMSDIRESLDALLQLIDVPHLSPEEVLAVAESRFLLRFGGIRNEMHERLIEIADREDVIGAEAACAALLIERQDWRPSKASSASQSMAKVMDQQAQKVIRVIEHPGFEQAMAQGRTKNFFGALNGLLIPPVRQQILPDLIELERYLDHQPQAVVLHGLTGLIRSTQRMDPNLRKADLDRLRARLVSEISDLREDALPGPSLAQDLAEDLRWLQAQVGQPTDLLGKEVPTLDFEWQVGLGEAVTLEDLRGQVVILDFWAWWCRGCLAGFKDLRELQKEFASTQLTILGVTSLQGRFPNKGELIDTSADPEGEYELLREFIEEKEITWPMAVSKQPVINPAFGISSLPCVIVLDRDGVVRHVGVRGKQFRSLLKELLE